MKYGAHMKNFNIETEARGQFKVGIIDPHGANIGEKKQLSYDMPMPHQIFLENPVEIIYSNPAPSDEDIKAIHDMIDSQKTKFVYGSIYYEPEPKFMVNKEYGITKEEFYGNRKLVISHLVKSIQSASQAHMIFKTIAVPIPESSFSKREDDSSNTNLHLNLMKRGVDVQLMPRLFYENPSSIAPKQIGLDIYVNTSDELLYGVPIKLGVYAHDEERRQNLMINY